jgi:ABC-2 type transport system permease protein
MIAVNRYIGLFFIQFRARLAYRINHFVNFFAALLHILVQYYLWTAIYANRDVLVGITKEEAISYIIFSFVVSSFITSNVDKIIADRIRSGDIALDLTRPYPFITGYFAMTMGDSVFNLLAVSLPLAVIGIVIFGARISNNPGNILMFIVTLGLGYILLFLNDFIIGTLTFWTKYAHGLSKLRWAIVSFFAGAIIPLDFFPDWLRQIADFLPYKAIYYIPLSWLISFGESRIWWEDVVFQLFWIILLYLLCKLLWAQAIKRVTVQGG